MEFSIQNKIVDSFSIGLPRLGYHFALDDFGSGMCSFSYLRNLPVDYLKIDGEFIRNIVDNPIDAAMVEAMSRISYLMGMKAIAEFVENNDILERIKVIGLDYAQGYEISRPHPLVQENPFQYIYTAITKKSRSSLILNSGEDIPCRRKIAKGNKTDGTQD